MAIDFANTAGSPNIDYITYSGVPPVAGLGTVSIALRLAGDSDCPNYGTLLNIVNTGSTNAVALGRNGTGSRLYVTFRNASTTIQDFPFTFDGAFRSVVVTWNGSASPKTVAYVDGVSQTILGSSGSHTTIGSPITLFELSSPAGNRWNGRFADFGIYNRVLTAAEAAQHAAGASCLLNPRGLICYVPGIRDVSDVVGSKTGTKTGTTVATHPRIYL